MGSGQPFLARPCRRPPTPNVPALTTRRRTVSRGGSRGCQLLQPRRRSIFFDTLPADGHDDEDDEAGGGDGDEGAPGAGVVVAPQPRLSIYLYVCIKGHT